MARLDPSKRCRGSFLILSRREPRGRVRCPDCGREFYATWRHNYWQLPNHQREVKER